MDERALKETPEEYLKGTADWRTDLYSSRGILLTHQESIELFKALARIFHGTPARFSEQLR